MTTDQLNYLNIGLMIVACAVAFIMPFELFLFSYAILGPLHYLTEISWLHKRQCFSPRKNDFILLAAFAVAITIPNVLPHFYELWGPKDADDHIIITDGLRTFVVQSATWVPSLTFAAFAGSALMIMAKETWKRVAGFVVIAFIGYLFHSEKIVFFIFSIFLPTMAHVFLFTGAFILVGALKSKSASGILSLVVFVLCPVCLFVLFPNTITPPGEVAMRNYNMAFVIFNQQIFEMFLHKSADADMIYKSGIGTMITRFIAFAYTYHYLNWFSKTSVIKWHQVPRKSLVMTLIIWALSVALYFFNYRTGIMALYFLSFVHVIFEFPLNFRSFKDIGVELRKRMGASAPATSA